MMRIPSNVAVLIAATLMLLFSDVARSEPAIPPSEEIAPEGQAVPKEMAPQQEVSTVDQNSDAKPPEPEPQPADPPEQHDQPPVEHEQAPEPAPEPEPAPQPSPQ
jgi:hypothetical protein